MIDWIKNITKEYPEFWRHYCSSFDNKTNRFVALSIETSGSDIQNDKILSIGAVAIIDNAIIVSDVFQMSLNKTNNTVVQDFLVFINNSVLIGHRINFEIDFLNIALEKMQCGRLKNEALDIEIMQQKLNLTQQALSIDELLFRYKIPKQEFFSSASEAYNIALLFLKLKQRLGL